MEPEVKRVKDVSYDAYPIDSGALIKLAIIGFATGVVGWLLYMAIATYFVEPVFCRSPETYAVCKYGGTIAWTSSHIIVMAAAVAIMAKMAVYRPLLVVLAAFIGLWASHAWLGGLDWYIALAWSGALFALAFAAFGWIARSASFLVAAILSVIIVVIARFVLMSA